MDNKTYFIGDLHLDHTNIIKYCNRPFKNTEEMNNHILDKWNSTISPTDKVYFLGDICYGKEARPRTYWWNKLNGHKILIKGNHDRYLREFKDVYTSFLLPLDGIDFLLIHSPDYVDEIEKYDWMIHGHHHNNNLEKYPLIHRENKTINVSVEVLDYAPLELNDLLKLIKEEW